MGSSSAGAAFEKCGMLPHDPDSASAYYEILRPGGIRAKRKAWSVKNYVLCMRCFSSVKGLFGVRLSADSRSRIRSTFSVRKSEGSLQAGHSKNASRLGICLNVIVE